MPERASTSDWPPEIASLISQLRAHGPQRYAQWHVDDFDHMVNDHARLLWNYLNAPQSERRAPNPTAASHVMLEYLNLTAEAVGLGYIQGIQEEGTRTFVEHCFRYLIPYGITKVAEAKRVAVLASVWNLAEGIAHEAPWLDDFVRLRIGYSANLEQLEQTLVDVLKPVISPQEPSTWSKSKRVDVINLRDHDADFLPGELFLAAPAILCIRDRRRPVHLGVLLQKKGESEILGDVGPLARYTPENNWPKLEFEPNLMQFGAAKATLPHLSHMHSWTASSSGFVIASAIDSQRLWIVETN
jgi:hypothetical protein